MFFVASQFGSACSPWIVLWLRKFYVGLPFLTLGGMQVIAGICAFTLSETLGKTLEDVVHSDSGK